MSNKIFRDKMGKEGLKKGASYKRGKHSYDLKLVNDIVERCETVLLGEHDGLVDFIMSAVPKQLDTIEHFDQDAFLEAIVLGWQQNVDYNNFHFALTKSIEALHSAGITTFNLNFNIVPQQLYVMFARLQGTENSQINLTCKGNFRQFGSRAEYCNLDLEGYVESFAQGAKFSTLRFSGRPGLAPVSGWGAEDSVYYVPRMDWIPFTVCERYAIFDLEYIDFSDFLPISDRCRFYVEQFDEKKFERIRTNGFWDHENRLYVPNGSGGWNERIPDGDGWKEVPEE